MAQHPQHRESGSSKRKDLEKEEGGGAGRRRWRAQRSWALRNSSPLPKRRAQHHPPSEVRNCPWQVRAKIVNILSLHVFAEPWMSEKRRKAGIWGMCQPKKMASAWGQRLVWPWQVWRTCWYGWTMVRWGQRSVGPDSTGHEEDLGLNCWCIRNFQEVYRCLWDRSVSFNFHKSKS